MNRNAMRIWLIVLLCLGLAGLAHAGQSIMLSSSPSTVKLIDQDRSGITIKVEIGKIDFAPVSTVQGSFVLATIDGFGRSFNTGEPGLPLAGKLFSIPFGCELDYKVVSSDVEEFSLTDMGITDPIIPAQPSLSKSDDPTTIPFEYNREIYARAGFYALPLVETEITGIMRAVRIGRIAISPVEYSPTENKIRVHNNITLLVSFRNADWELTKTMQEDYYSPAFEPVYSQLLNYPDQTLSMRSDLVRHPITYVIISHRMFETQLQPFIQWKIKKGFKVIVGYTDVIGTTNTAIKSYIQNLYNTESPAPSFVLFVGDAQQIPPFNGSAGSHITDKNFCEFTGDLYPEIYYGRFSAQNTTQLQPQIDKTLEYEKYLMPDPSYLSEVTLVSGVDGTYASTYGNGQLNYGTNYYFNIAHGITPQVWLYPASAGGGAAAAIIQSVSDGVGLYNYTAHCSHEGHADPPFETSNISGLTNYHKYLLGIGNCCLSNTFGTDYGTPCFGEAFLQVQDKGGIGYIGGTNSTYWDEDYWWGVGYGPVVGSGPTYEQTTLGAYDGIFHTHGEPIASHYVTNDAIIYAGNMAVSASSSSRKAYYWEIYHLMGDPSVITYMGVPTTNNISHASSVLLTALSFTVNADPESYVGISYNGVLHGAGFVDSSGSVTIPLTAFASPGTADIVVTAQNRIPYMATVQVIAPEGPFVIYDNYTINDIGGNNDGQINCGEPISLGVQLINVGPDTARGVSVVMTTADPYVTLTDANETYGDIPGNNGTLNIADAFSFSIAGNAPDNHKADFILEVTGSARDTTWTSNLSITVHSPEIGYVSHIAAETIGNGNGNFDPGETAELTVALSNSGSADAVTLVGVLSGTDPYVTISDADGAFGTIASGGGTADNSADKFIVSADPSCPIGHLANMQIALTGTGGYFTTVNLSLVVGDRVVFFFDDFSFNQGWTGTGGSGEWSTGPAVGGAGSDSYGGPDPNVDHSSSDDNYVLGNDLTSGTGGDYNPSLATTYWVTSPQFDCSGMTGVQLRFWRWLGIESSSYDHAYLAVYNGASWVNLFENSATMDENSWTEQFYDLSSYADGNANFQFRFGIGTTDGSYNYCGWNIDDVELKGYGDTQTGTPQLVYLPNDFADSLSSGQSHVDTVKVSNPGAALLRIRFTSATSWLAFDTAQHNVFPADSLIFPVTVNTSGLAVGNHAGTLNYTSNDPLHPSGSIQMNLHIWTPDIYIPLTSVDETVPVGNSLGLPLIISNNGPGQLDYSISRIMYNGKKIAKVLADQPLGYRVADAEKSGGSETEPFYAAVTKNSGGPDTWGYSWVDSDEPSGPVFGWVDISGAGTTVTLGDDDSTASIPIGFGFPFYENTYSALNIGSNGIVTFAKGSTARTNTNFPNVAVPNNVIALWWDDLDPRKGGNIYYYSDVANSRFIISFVGIKNYYSTTGTGTLTFQAILYSNGKIMLQYGTMDPGVDVDSLKGSTIGIENSGGADGLTVVYNAPYMHNDMAILFTAADWLSIIPASGIIPAFSSDTLQIGLDATELPEGLYSGKLTVNSNDPDTPTRDIPVAMTVGSAYICGDANGNGIVNALDVTYLINFLYKSGPVPVPVQAGDANGNGIVNALDVTHLINFLYKQGPAPVCP